MSALALNVRDTTLSKLVKRLIEDQHSILLSVALHLIPGVLILVAYLLIAAPLVQALGYPPYLGWVVAMCLALAPVELGLLLYLSWKKNGKLSLRGVVHYTEKPLKTGALVGYVVILIIGLVIATALLTPVDTFVYNHLFSWIPFESAGGAGGFLSGYARSTVIVTLVFGYLNSSLKLLKSLAKITPQSYKQSAQVLPGQQECVHAFEYSWAEIT